jgi:MFS family permease
MASVIIFEIGSVVCATAPNSPAFIIGRTVAGVGAGGIFVGTLVIIGYVAPIDKRPTFLALTGMMFALSSIVGPILGGKTLFSRLQNILGDQMH